MPEMTTTLDITRKTFAPAELQFTPGERSCVAWLTLEVPDHESDVVVASGVDFTSVFLGETPTQGNPCVLASHDAGRWPVGKCSWIRLKKNAGFTGLYGKIVFDEDPDADIVWRKVKAGTLKGVSIGFRAPDDIKPGEWGPPSPDELRRNPHWKGARRVIRRCLLLEFSVCSLGMNPRALIESVNKGINPPVYSPSSEASKMSDAAHEAAVSGIIAKATVPYHAYPVSEKDWDADAAKARFLERAGGKDDFKPAAYEVCFAACDSAKPEDIGSYHLPHHDIEDGKIVTSKKGVEAALGALNGARGGYSGPDAEGARAHLEKHRAEWAGGDGDEDDKPEEKAAPEVETKDMADGDGMMTMSLGQHVRCMKSGGCGTIKAMHTDGMHPEDMDEHSPHVYTATEDNPVAHVHMHDGKCMRMGKVKAMHMKDLAPMEAAPDPMPKGADAPETKDLAENSGPHGGYGTKPLDGVPHVDSDGDEPTEDEITPKLPDLRRGDHVKIDGAGHKGFGKIVSVHKEGDFVPDVAEHVIGTADHPAARVHRFKKSGDAYVKTGHYTGHPFGHMTKADMPRMAKGFVHTPAPGKPTAKAAPEPAPAPEPELPPLVPMTDAARAEAEAKALADAVQLAIELKSGHV